MRLLDNEGQPVTLIGWMLGTERGAFSLVALTLLALALIGCAPVQSAGGIATKPPVQAAADSVVVEGGRALILANLAYQTAGTAAATAIEMGWLKGDAKVKVQSASQRAVDALSAGERAVLTADKASQAAAALSAVGDLCELHPFIKAACARAQ